MFFRMVYKSGQIFLPFCHNTRVWQTDGRTDGRTDGWTDRRTDRILIARPRLHYMQLGKKRLDLHEILSQMYLWSRKSLLNFWHHLDPEPGFGLRPGLDSSWRRCDYALFWPMLFYYNGTKDVREQVIFHREILHWIIHSHTARTF